MPPATWLKMLRSLSCKIPDLERTLNSEVKNTPGKTYTDGDRWNPEKKCWEKKDTAEQTIDLTKKDNTWGVTRAINMKFAAPPSVIEVWREMVELELAYMNTPGMIVNSKPAEDNVLIKDIRGKWHVEFDFKDKHYIEARWRGEGWPLFDYIGPFRFWFKKAVTATGTDTEFTNSVALITKSPVYEERAAYEFSLNLVGKVTLNLVKTYEEKEDDKNPPAIDKKVAEELGAQGCGD